MRGSARAIPSKDHRLVPSDPRERASCMGALLYLGHTTRHTHGQVKESGPIANMV